MVQERSRARKAPAPASRRPAAPRSPRVQAKRERRRDEILHAALRAFRERGYHDTTLDAHRERLGVRKTALYHYFPDKQAILHACHRESMRGAGAHPRRGAKAAPARPSSCATSSGSTCA